MNDSAIVFPNSPNKLKDSFFVVYKKVESGSVQKYPLEKWASLFGQTDILSPYMSLKGTWVWGCP
jgi:hypothetical protein